MEAVKNAPNEGRQPSFGHSNHPIGILTLAWRCELIGFHPAIRKPTGAYKIPDCIHVFSYQQQTPTCSYKGVELDVSESQSELTQMPSRRPCSLFLFVFNADGTLYQQKGDIRKVNLKCSTAIGEPYYFEDKSCIYSPSLERFS